MKNENEFNSKLGKNLRKLESTHFIKASDKFTVGVSDFIIWSNGLSFALENKFIREFPSKKTKLFKGHKFTGPQITFLESVHLTHTRAWGGVYVDCEKKFYLVPSYRIPPDGNWKTENFIWLVEQGLFGKFDWDDTTGIIQYMRSPYGT